MRAKSLRNTSFFLGSLAVTIIILGSLFSQISLEEVVSLISGAERQAVIAFVLLSFATSFVRMWRYSLLLEATGYHAPKIGLYLVTLVRNCFADLLPARLGTLIYIFLVSTRLGIPVGPASATFALAFILDVIALAPLVLVCGAFVGGNQLFSLPALFGGAVILAGISIVMLLCLPLIVHIANSLVTRARFLRVKYKVKILHFLDTVSEGLKRTQDARIYGRVLTLSLLIRLGKYVSLYLFLYALLSPRGYELSDLSFPRIFLGLCGSELAASLPISGIMGFGAYQGAWVITFNLLGFPLEIAKLTSIAHHLFTQLYGYSLGLAALGILCLPIFYRPLIEQPAKLPRASLFSFTLQVALTLFCITSLLVILLTLG